jgi:hypothetical protein
VVHLVEPVTLRSRLRRRPGVVATEVAGLPVLCDADARTTHPLSAAAARLWTDLDGRPLAAHLDQLTSSDDAPTEVALIELIRRLRAVDLIEDCGPGDGAAANPVPHPAPTSAAAPPQVAPDQIELAGSRLDVAGRDVVIVTHWDSQTSDDRLRIRPSSIVEAPSPPGLAVVRPDRPTERLTVLVTFATLVEAAAPDVLTEAGIEVLAQLAEAWPAIQVVDRSDVMSAVARLDS